MIVPFGEIMVPLLRQIIQRVPSTSWHVENEVSMGCQEEKLAKKLKKIKGKLIRNGDQTFSTQETIEEAKGAG